MHARATISIRNYVIVTAAYWAFTLTDGALRMLVLLHFNQLGYTPVQLAFLFLLYEFFGIVTNLVGGWLAARTGLRLTLVLGLGAAGGRARAAGAAEPRVEHGGVGGLRDGLPGAVGHRQGPDEDEREERRQGARPEGRRVRPVQVGGGPHRLEERAERRGLLRRRLAAVDCWDFAGRSAAMAGGVLLVLVVVLAFLPASIGQAKKKPAFAGILSNSPGINRLSLARLALFAARDVWFVVSVPIFLASVLGWSFTQVGGFMALWVIAYGGVQSVVAGAAREASPADGRRVRRWRARSGSALAAVTALIPIGLQLGSPPALTMLGGLGAVRDRLRAELVGALVPGARVLGSRSRVAERGVLLHGERGGRLLGTLLSGVLYQSGGVAASLWGAVALAAAAGLIALFLPPVTGQASWQQVKSDE